LYLFGVYFTIGKSLYYRGMTMFKVRRFKELTVDELYKILALRSEVFVVEQK